MAAHKIKGDLRIEGEVLVPNETASRVPQIDSFGKLKSSTTTSTELGHLSGVTSAIQTQLNAKAIATDLSDHISDAVDAHDASAISSIPSGNLAATEVQAALNELQSDVDSRALDSAVTKKDGSVAFTANQSMGGFKLTSLGAPAATSDAATKGYVDNALEGLKPKEAVRLASTADVVIASALENGDTIDGVVLVTGDRVLLKNQTLPEQNGIYIASASGAASRSTDFDSVSPIDEINKAFIAVQEGTSNAGKLFVQYGAVVTVGVDAINFTFFNSISGLTGDDGIAVSGSSISIDHDGQGLQFVTNQLSLELDGSTLVKGASGLKLNDTAVAPAAYGSASAVGTFTVDAQGRLTAASDSAISITASQVSDFNEAAQDAVGGALLDTASIDFTYNDGANQISAAVLPAGVDHDSLQNFVANKHIDHTAVVLSGATNGGITSAIGDISASRTISVDITNATAETSADNADSILIYDNSATALRKMTRSNFLSGIGGASAGDLNETSFAAANNQAAAADVTGLAFANGTVRSFSALVSVTVDATADLFEEFELKGIQKGASWDMSVAGVGDDSGLAFTITNAGQIQYTSANVAGFVSNTVKFRAITTSV